MFQPPDDFDTNPFFNGRNKKQNREELDPEELADVNPEDLLYRKKELGKIFIWLIGFGLGLGGLLGAQISTRFLPKLPDKIVGWCFNILMMVIAVYTFWKAFSI